VARIRAAYQRSYFAPALFSLIPVETDLIGSMAVDAQWRLVLQRRVVDHALGRRKCGGADSRG